ncbi:MAG: AmmeMemoRadiSam system protein B [Candidatus Omnitrophota bacterium]
MRDREPVVSGQFYPGTKSALARQLETLIPKQSEKRDILGAVVPHAGYIYSGTVAGSVYAALSPGKTYILLGPNHTGAGYGFSIINCGTWSTPLGKVKINNKLATALIDRYPKFKVDEQAHAYEHSIEVQLPFLQYIAKDFDFVPVVLSTAQINEYEMCGEHIAGAIKDYGKDVVILASSDFTHYESDAQARYKDQLAIDAILQLDEQRLLNNIQQYNITMCGWAPIIVMLVCCKKLGAKSAKLIKYQTSGDTSGDYTSVVGYAGIIVS